jgi:PKD repeat protein
VDHTYSEGGTYAVRLSVMDNRGASAASTRFVRVSATLTPPIAAADVTPLGGSRPLVIGFDGSASSDPDGIVSSHWDLGDGQTFSGAAGSHRYDRPGTYEITLTVTDTLGSSAQVARTVQVDDVSSLPTSRLDVANVDPSAGDVQFDAGGLPPGAIVTWDFGDGQVGTGPSVLHQYAAPGAYRVVLSIDSGGQVSTVGRWIAVGEAQIPSDAPRSDPGAAFILYTPLAPTP